MSDYIVVVNQKKAFIARKRVGSDNLFAVVAETQNEETARALLLKIEPPPTLVEAEVILEKPKKKTSARR